MQVLPSPVTIHANNGTVTVDVSKGITLTVTVDGVSLTLDGGTIYAGLLASALKDAAREWRKMTPR